MKLIFLLIFLIFTADGLYSNDLQNARDLYYKSAQESDYIDSAIEAFEKLAKSEPAKECLSKVYIGSLTAMRAVPAFWPQDKLEWANKGIEKMDKAVKNCSDCVEALFIQGTTLHYLPFFFNKGDEADANFQKVIQIISAGDLKKFDEELLKNVLNFILEESDLSDNYKSKAEKLLEKIKT